MVQTSNITTDKTDVVILHINFSVNEIYHKSDISIMGDELDTEPPYRISRPCHTSGSIGPHMETMGTHLYQ